MLDRVHGQESIESTLGQTRARRRVETRRTNGWLFVHWISAGAIDGRLQPAN